MGTTFTVAIPTHNRRETVVLAARSALRQTRPPEQVIVLCDGCDDGTAEALRGLGDARVQALELPKGEGYAYGHRNRSLELATGEAIVWLGDDDLLLPDHLERIGELWDTSAQDLVQSMGVLVDPDDTVRWAGTDWAVPHFAEQLRWTNSNAMAMVSLRVALAREVGGWDAALPRRGDRDLWLRALAGGARVACSPEPTVLHFYATGRTQPWPQRVAQNARWAATLEHPAELTALRIRLRRARDEHDAEIDAHRAALIARHDELWPEVQRLTTEVAAVRAALVATEAHLAQTTERLHRIEAGGWWRLRQRLLPLLRLAGRSR